jgi:hypothetical protein
MVGTPNFMEHLQTKGVELMKFIPEISSLVLITTDAKILSFRIEVSGPTQFDIVDKF